MSTAPIPVPVPTLVPVPGRRDTYEMHAPTHAAQLIKMGPGGVTAELSTVSTRERVVPCRSECGPYTRVVTDSEADIDAGL